MAPPMEEILLLAKLAITALKVLRDEKMAENAEAMGNLLRDELKKTTFKTYQHYPGKRIIQCNCD